MGRRPRVGIVAYDYLPVVGGMGTYARALGLHFHNLGHEVHLFAGEQSQLDPPLQVHPILTADLARDLRRLARFDMDLWHAVNFGYAPLACIKRPFVLTVHGTDFLTPWVRFTMDRVPWLWRASHWLNTKTVRRALYGVALRFVDQVLAPSRFSVERFRREYPSVGRLSVAPNGVDNHFLQALKTDHPMARHPRRLLTVSNLGVANRRKNVDGCLRAMALVGDALDLEYWIAGSGPGQPALEQLAEELGVNDRVRFLGRVNNDQLRAAYASSSLFVLVPKPRPGDVEGFGIVYLEAAASGTPSLASRCGGTVDAIAEGQSGFFSDDPTPDGIANALTRFFTGQVRFDEAVVRRHAARYAWPTVLTEVEDVYKKLLGARHNGSSPRHRS